MADLPDRSNDAAILEDCPLFRSVAIISQDPVSRLAHHQYQDRTLIKSNGVKTCTVGRVWNVSSLMSIPRYYQLEPTYVTIPDDVTLTALTNRIVDVIRHESIAAVFDDTEGKVSGETKCGVKFVLRLWTSMDNQVVVEMQKEAGCGFIFCQTAKKVLKAAKTGKLSKKSKGSVKSSSVRDVHLNVIPLDNSESLVVDSLNLARNRFNEKDRMDVHVLATSSLVHLTSSRDYRVDAARFMMSPSFRDIFQVIVSLIVCSRLSRDQSNNIGTLSAEQVHFDTMHRHAIAILANSLMALEERDELGVVVDEMTPDVVSDDLLKALVRVIDHAALKPHEAADAFECLKILCRQCNYTKERIFAFGGSLNLEHPPKFF